MVAVVLAMVAKGCYVSQGTQFTVIAYNKILFDRNSNRRAYKESE